MFGEVIEWEMKFNDGWNGLKMEKEGLKSIAPIKRLAVMGFWEVLKGLGWFWEVFTILYYIWSIISYRSYIIS